MTLRITGCGIRRRDFSRIAVHEADHAGRHARVDEGAQRAAGEGGVSSGAFTRNEQPVASAALSLRTTHDGKFHGVKAATGPTALHDRLRCRAGGGTIRPATRGLRPRTIR